MTWQVSAQVLPLRGQPVDVIRRELQWLPSSMQARISSDLFGDSAREGGSVSDWRMAEAKSAAHADFLSDVSRSIQHTRDLAAFAMRTGTVTDCVICQVSS